MNSQHSVKGHTEIFIYKRTFRCQLKASTHWYKDWAFELLQCLNRFISFNKLFKVAAFFFKLRLMANTFANIIKLSLQQFDSSLPIRTIFILSKF